MGVIYSLLRADPFPRLLVAVPNNVVAVDMVYDHVQFVLSAVHFIEDFDYDSKVCTSIYLVYKLSVFYPELRCTVHTTLTWCRNY